MTISTIQGYVTPDYHDKIYIFDEVEIETKLKDFITSNPNLQCLVRINFKQIPAHTVVLKSSTNYSEEKMMFIHS